MTVTLGGHQLTAIKKLKNGSVLTGGVGTGKSRTAIAYYYTQVAGGSVPINGEGAFEPAKRHKTLYVITTARKRDDLDWIEEALAFRIARDLEDSSSGVQIIVDSWNNIAKYEGVRDAFFIFDEQRLVGSGAWVKAYLKIAKANKWIMLSATPGDTWLDYIPLFVANGFYRNRTDFMITHVVYNHFSKYPKVDRYLETGALEAHRRSILVAMPYQRHTTRHVKETKVKFPQETFDRVVKDRWHVYEERPIRDVSELFACMRKVVNTDPSRLGAVMEAYEKHARLIVFYNFDYELELLRTLSSTLGVTVAEWNGHKHEPVPDSERWIYLVQYSAGSEAWNCVATDAILFYSLNYSWRITEQAKGRIDRLNTKYINLYYYLLRSNSAIDTMILKALHQKRSFNESEVMPKGTFVTIQDPYLK